MGAPGARLPRQPGRDRRRLQRFAVLSVALAASGCSLFRWQAFTSTPSSTGASPTGLRSTGAAVVQEQPQGAAPGPEADPGEEEDYFEDPIGEITKRNGTFKVYSRFGGSRFAARVKPAGVEERRMFPFGSPKKTREAAKLSAAELVMGKPALRNLLEKWGAEGRDRRLAIVGTPLSELEVGQTLEGVVMSVMEPKGKHYLGCFLDVGAEQQGFLSVAEYTDGFPGRKDIAALSVGNAVSVRVLRVGGDKLSLTRRTGDVSRAPLPKVQWDGDVAPFAGLGPEVWLDAEVVEMTTVRVSVLVTPPGGQAPAVAKLFSNDFSEEFASVAKMGCRLRVRVKFVDEGRRRLVVTMKPYDRDAMQSKSDEKERERAARAKVSSELQVGQTFEGTVAKLTRRGCFLDVGAEKDGYMQAAEFTDGFPIKVLDLAEGSRVTVRVLKVEDGSFWLTRRSGDLARPSLPQAPRTNDIAPFYSLPENTWLDAQVNAMTVYAVFVLLTPPGGGEVAGAQLSPEDFKRGFASTVTIGSRVKVRIKNIDVNQKFIFVSMKEGAASRARAVLERMQRTSEE